MGERAWTAGDDAALRLMHDDRLTQAVAADWLGRDLVGIRERSAILGLDHWYEPPKPWQARYGEAQPWVEREMVTA